MPPDENDRRPGQGADQDGAGGYVTASVPPAADTGPDDEVAAYVDQLRRRREASWRLPPLETGFRDPLDQRAAS